MPGRLATLAALASGSGVLGSEVAVSSSVFLRFRMGSCASETAVAGDCSSVAIVASLLGKQDFLSLDTTVLGSKSW
jgi:hypothetical protein